MRRFASTLTLILLIILSDGCEPQQSPSLHDSPITSTSRLRSPGPVPFTPDPTEPPPAIHLVELASFKSSPNEPFLHARDPIPSGQPWLVRLTVDLDATGRAAPTVLETDDRWQGFLIPKFVIQSGTRPGTPYKDDEPFPLAQATITVNAAGVLALDGTVYLDMQALTGKLGGQCTRVIVQPDPNTPAQHLLPVLDALAAHRIQWYFSSEAPHSVSTGTPTKVRYTLQERFRELIDSAVARDVAAFPAAKPLRQMVLRLRCDATTPYREIRKFLVMNLGDRYDCRRFSLTVLQDGRVIDIGPLHLNPSEETEECYWYRRDYDWGTAANLLIPADTPPVLAYCDYRNHGEDGGLAWLAANQAADGHWDSLKFGATGRCDTAATALAVLAFSGAGHTDRRGRWCENVHRALRWLAVQQDKNGCFQMGVNGPEATCLLMRGLREKTLKDLSYCPDFTHALSTLAFTEVWGWSKSPWLKAVALRGLAYAFETDRPNDAEHSMNQSGWDLHRRPGSDKDQGAGNLYVSTWYITLAASARLAGLPVNHAAPAELLAVLDRYEVPTSPPTPDLHRYAFTPGEPADPAATQLGNLARLYCGEPKTSCAPGAEWTFQRLGLPPWGGSGEDLDLFGCWTGTILYFRVGGESWTRWSQPTRDLICSRQQKLGQLRGSWNPTGTNAPHGRVVSTALAALNLEVYYRYSPLYGPGALPAK